MSNLKWADVAHYYLRSNIEVEGLGLKFVPAAFYQDGTAFNGFNRILPPGMYHPILRHLEDMTDQDAREIWAIYDPSQVGRNFEIEPENHALDHFTLGEFRWDAKLIKLCIGMSAAWSWLISKGFDVFGLIESEQAIRKGVEGA